MYKKYLKFTVLWLILSLFVPCMLYAKSNFQAKSLILMNMDTRKVIFEENADKLIAPASLTKIMSMYIVFDQIKAEKIKLTDKVKISAKAANTGGSRMGLKKGEKVTVEKLLLGMAVSSGNDASVALAEHVAGSSADFVTLMNKKAQKLGMKKTKFKNVHGLPAKDQVTTAREMLALSRNYIANHPQSLRYHNTKTLSHNKVTTTNKNPTLDKIAGADGLKTGWITASGYNIVSTARQGKTRLIAVVLGADTPKIRAKDVEKLLQAGFTYSKGKSKSVAAALTSVTLDPLMISQNLSQACQASVTSVTLDPLTHSQNLSQAS